jgi:Tfp pilus assembly protein PilN
VLLLFGLIEFGLAFYFSYTRRQNELEYVKEKYEKDYAKIINELEQNEKKKKNFEKVKSVIENIRDNKSRWLDILSELAMLLNDPSEDGLNTRNLWIDNLEFPEKQTIIIKGYSKSFALVTSFIKTLNASKHFNVDPTERPRMQERLFGETIYQEFSIKVGLRHKAEIKEETKK